MDPQPDLQIADAMGSFMSLPDAITLFFYIVAFVYIVYSIILHYHWKQYGTNKAVNVITLSAYALTTVPLILIMAALTFSF